MAAETADKAKQGKAKRIERDLGIITRFIEVFCHAKHSPESGRPGDCHQKHTAEREAAGVGESVADKDAEAGDAKASSMQADAVSDACSQHGVEKILGNPSKHALCPDCRDLLAYATDRLNRCPMDPKPKCKDCPVHCYKPEYRGRIQEVMKFSGIYFVKRGRIDWLIKYFS